ncbi:unnamed protein product [Urochloa humidicola]
MGTLHRLAVCVPCASSLSDRFRSTPRPPRLYHAALRARFPSGPIDGADEPRRSRWKPGRRPVRWRGEGGYPQRDAHLIWIYSNTMSGRH